MSISEPLYISVSSALFHGYERPGKTWEVQPHEKVTAQDIVKDRAIAITKQSNDQRIWSELTGRYTVGTLEDIFRRLPLECLDPHAKNSAAAIQKYREYFASEQLYTAFEMNRQFSTLAPA